jgi:hypothetical protein
MMKVDEEVRGRWVPNSGGWGDGSSGVRKRIFTSPFFLSTSAFPRISH